MVEVLLCQLITNFADLFVKGIVVPEVLPVF
jgi:hypothetical protein